jgi:hypothetical protein
MRPSRFHAGRAAGQSYPTLIPAMNSRSTISILGVLFALLAAALVAQNVSIYTDQGGATQHIGSGGTLSVDSGGTINVKSGGSLTVGTGATSLTQTVLCLDIADGSADATYYLVSPHAGTISKIYTVTDGTVSTADITVTGNIGVTAITTGVVTIATAASAAGDVDSATPTAANTITAGAAMNFVVAGGGAGGSPRIHLVVVIDRT